MSEERWTKGPWQLRRGGYGVSNTIEGPSGLPPQFEGDDGYRTVATYQSNIDGTHAEKEANALANANLIAAAPAMAEALKRIEEISGDFSIGDREAIKKIRPIVTRALAQAHGEGE